MVLFCHILVCNYVFISPFTSYTQRAVEKQIWVKKAIQSLTLNTKKEDIDFKCYILLFSI